MNPIRNINDLPDDVLSSVLSLLPAKEAFRARILCHRWRNLFATSIPILEFDELEDAKRCFDSCLFVSDIDHQLMERRMGRPNIGTFKLQVSNFRSEFAPEIDKWVACAIGMEATKIDLYLNRFSSSCNKIYKFPGELLPLSTTSSEKSRLRHLRLRSCSLEITSSTSLHILDLCDVPLDQSSLDSILSGCLNLVSLSLSNCCFSSKGSYYSFCMDQGKLRCLKTLVINERLVRHIDLNSITLEFFEVCTSDPITVNIVGPHLKRLALWLGAEGVQKLITVLPSLPQLECLWLILFFQMMPLSSSIKYSTLKELHLTVIVKPDFFTITYLLNASPVLEIFHMQLTCRDGITRAANYSQQVYMHLKEIKINEFRDCGNVLEFTIYLLSNAIALERMVLHFSTEEKDEWKTEVTSVLQKEKMNPLTDLIFH